MIIGIPKEIKEHETRVGLVPAGVEVLVGQGHEVLIEKDAGVQSNFLNEDYEEAGGIIVQSGGEVYGRAELVVKVKEPLPVEFPLIREGQILFAFFHFAASRGLTEGILKTGASAMAYETIQLEDGSLPLLIPMSEVAGRLSVPIGATLLQRENGGRGILIGGIPGVSPGHVLIIGAGTAGMQAALMAAGLGAQVSLLDNNLQRLQHLASFLPHNVTTYHSNPATIQELIRSADLTITSVLIPGAKTPKLITRDMLKTMQARSVIVDIAIDQGGSLESSRPTSFTDPTYIEEDILHYCVTNMPAATPITSTIALTNVTFPYIELLANLGLDKALQVSPALAKGLNIRQGKIVYPGIDTIV